MHRGPDAYYPWKILNLGVLKWLSKLIEDRHADLLSPLHKISGSNKIYYFIFFLLALP